jgi:RHS repeat-associated protein
VTAGGTRYVMGDRQGSTRLVMGGVVARHDYLPYGEEVGAGVGMRTPAQGYGQPDGVRRKYAGMEEDEAAGMSHTSWREYDNLSARWAAPDPYSGSMDLASPQTFNRYVYVNNDPVNHIDPTGLMAADAKTRPEAGGPHAPKVSQVTIHGLDWQDNCETA